MWTRILTGYLALWFAVEIARLFTWSVRVFWAHELLTGLALIVGAVAVSLAAEEWVAEAPQ